MKKFLCLIIIIFSLISCDRLSKIQLVFWEKDVIEAEKILNEQINLFKEKNSGIEIIQLSKSKQELLEELNRRSNKIDIIRYPSEYLDEFVKNKKLISCNQVFNSEFFDMFIQEALVSTTIEEKIWAIPDNFGKHVMLFYNKSKIKKPPTDTGKMIKLGKKWTRKSENIFGLVYNLKEPAFIHQWWHGFGGEILTEEGKPSINTKKINDSFQFIYDLKYRYKIVPSKCDYNDADTLFKNGNAAMIINREWAIKDYMDSLGNNLGITSIPMVLESGEFPATWASTMCYAITKKLSKRRLEAAKKFIKFMTSKENQKDWIKKMQRLPSLKSFEKEELIIEDALLHEVWNALLKSKGKPPNWKVNMIYKAIRPQLEKMMDDQISPQAATEKAQEYAEQMWDIDNEKRK